MECMHDEAELSERIKVTMDNLKCNYLATSPPFILQAVKSRRMKQVILEVDKIQLVVRGVQQPTL